MLALQIRNFLVFVVAFAEWSRQLLFAFGGYFVQGVGFWHWLRYGLSVMLEDLSFGATSLYGWHISEIQPTAWWSRASIVLFNIALGSWIVAAILKVRRESQNEAMGEAFSPTSAFVPVRLVAPVSYLIRAFILSLGAAPLLVALEILYNNREIGFGAYILGTLAYSALVTGLVSAVPIAYRLRRVSRAKTALSKHALGVSIAVTVCGLVATILLQWNHVLP